MVRHSFFCTDRKSKIYFKIHIDIFISFLATPQSTHVSRQSDQRHGANKTIYYVYVYKTSLKGIYKL